MYYSYDPFGDFKFHETAEQAKAAFEEAVDYRKEALSDGDCDDNMADISWGLVSQKLNYSDRKLTAKEKESYDFAFIREISVEDVVNAEVSRKAGETRRKPHGLRDRGDAARS